MHDIFNYGSYYDICNNFEYCDFCGKCALFCPNDARELCGKEYTVDEVLVEILKELNIDLDAVINLNVADEEIIKRIVNRRLCSKCGAGYNVVTMPPKKEGICDVCNSPLYTRADDNEETVKVRLSVYNEQTKPLVEYYEALNKILNINSNQSIEDAVKEIVKAVEDKCSH